MGSSCILQPADSWGEAVVLCHRTSNFTLVETVKYFGYYLYGKMFTVYTDHQPLCQLLTSDRLNGKLRRMAMKLQHWLLTVEYLPSQDNGFVDPLSREERLRLSQRRAPVWPWGCGETAPLMIRLRGKPLVGVPRQNSEQCILHSPC